MHGSKGVKLEQIKAYNPRANEVYRESVIRLSDVPFPLLDSLEACKDSSLEFLMSQLVLTEERSGGSGEFAFNPPVEEEVALPNSLLQTITRRPRAIAAYKERKRRAYGKKFDVWNPELLVSEVEHQVTATGELSLVIVHPGPNPSSAVTGPTGEDEKEEEEEEQAVHDDMFDTSVLDGAGNV